MKKKILVTAIASVLIAPAAFAAEGSDGMTYTSASEGFYGSLRASFDTGGKDGDQPTISNGSWSRVGVRGTLDMGSGLTGFYQWETNVTGEQGAATAMRLGNVGIRGAFGEVKVGSFTDTMIGVSGHTDVTNSVSGQFDISKGYRVDNAIAYTTPDLNGFQASMRVVAENVEAEFGSGTPDVSTDDIKVDDSEGVDDWAINASYSVQGLTAVAGYRVNTSGASEVILSGLGADGEITGNDNTYSTKSEDVKSWGAGLGYGQDNWNVGFWYGEVETVDADVTEQLGKAVSGANNDELGSVTFTKGEDIEILSIGGSVVVGKTTLMAFTETASIGSFDDTVSGVGIQYSFTANSRVWMDYQANDKDSSDTEDDRVVIGLRHDF